MAVVMYKEKVDKHCSICGKPIVYGINGAQMHDTCMDCKPIRYYCEPKPIDFSFDFDALDAMEDRCINFDFVD